ncbi:glycoside hydrolase family 43 protein [Actinosynnema sp. NPDC050801]|uniref:glycoside hydrolase family 43 protein n=1 Tax=unclassified Actinosynnema TaxID=2637065 RepID=UPI0033EC76E7
MNEPIITRSYPDPSVCRVGKDYYLVSSRFEHFPGVPIFHSRDLTDWVRIGTVPDRPPAGAVSAGGIYAPTLRHYDGRFWLVATRAQGGGNVLVSAEDPAGPWSAPTPLPGVPGIDPDLVWDEDGNCWCTYAGVEQVRIDPATGRILGTPTKLWSGSPGPEFPVAPHLYRIGEHWYLTVAEVGTERSHAISIARGPTVNGPFEPCPDNPILTDRGPEHPVRHAGHGDLVQAPDGAWWMVFLGMRSQGGTPGRHGLGRETFLAPVHWVDGWPVVGEPSAGPATPPRHTDVEPITDDFDESDLHPHWN